MYEYLLIFFFLFQLKLGEGTPDAVNKSSITWACGDRKGGTKKGKTRALKGEEEVQNLENMKKKVEAQEIALSEMKFGSDGKNLYTEVLRLVEGRLKEINDEPKNLPEKSNFKDLSEVEALLENLFRQNQSRSSLLIAVGAKEGSGFARNRPLYEGNCDQNREYYTTIEGTHTKTIFSAMLEGNIESPFGLKQAMHLYSNIWEQLM